jgi:hypothetical protein
MAKQFFVLGIGGTGMRCIESLIHLCAIGMFDNTEINLLALDTDKNNGNFSRLKEVKEAYLNAKGLNAADRVALSDTYFSANIKYYEFSPNYEQKSTFQDVFNYGDTQYNHREETDLANLMFTDNVEKFNLRHGYRAQTHLGSMMMYQSIVEAARANVNNDLKGFLGELTRASQNGHPRVFILGSVFGGTGASSIPIVPQAISKAAEIISNGAVNVLKSAYFGSTLLTAYFNFKAPSSSELVNQKIIATSDKFALNSQVAMMFYDDDSTVRSTYQKFYMLGTEGIQWNPMQRDEEIKETITGGEQQKNDSHYIELLAACAALEFYNTDENTLKENKDNVKTDYLYRAIKGDGKFEFQDFVGSTRAVEFAKKFGTLIAFSILCNGTYDFVESVRTDGQKEITGYENIKVNQVQNLKEYFNLFFVRPLNSGDLTEGWLKQIHRSAGSGDNFLFNAKLFAPKTMKELMNFPCNKELYRSEGIGKDNKFSTKSIKQPFGTMFNTFKDAFIEQLRSGKPQNITDPGEQLYKLIYDTLSKLYKFN